MISEHITQWLGFPVELFDCERAKEGVSDYSRTLYRLALDWDAEADFPTLFERFLAGEGSDQTPAIVIGQFHGDSPGEGSGEVVQLLVSARNRLPRLKGIFIGDMVTEESEVSWIVQSDLSPVLTAYPELEHLRVRGTDQLTLGGRIAHEKLKSLTIETGGLPPALLREVAASHLPALEHLELWLGTPGYGGDATLADVRPFLGGSLFPRLKYLGLRDSEIVDEIAGALKDAPILSRLETLDLSLGTLSDAGGKQLLATPALKNLKGLDLHHHYLSDSMMAALQAAFPSANLEDQQEGDGDDRYVAVSE